MRKMMPLMLVFALVACSAPAPAVPTTTATPLPTLTATATFTMTPEPTPTITVTPDPLAGLPEEVRKQIESGNPYNLEKGLVYSPDGRVMSMLLPSGEWKVFNGKIVINYCSFAKIM